MASFRSFLPSHGEKISPHNNTPFACQHFVTSFIIILLTACLTAPALAEESTTSQNSWVQSIHKSSGLVDLGGNRLRVHRQNKTTGKRINVTDAPYGADPADNEMDDRPAIEQALRDASPGDEVYLPAGTYNLKSAWSEDSKFNIHLKSYVNFVGENQEETILKTTFDDEGSGNYGVLVAKGVHHIAIRNFTVTSTWTENYSSDPSLSNPYSGGPTNAITTMGLGKRPAYKITFKNIRVEKFRRAGFRISAGSHNVVIRSCLAEKATDVGGGGAGYGFLFQGAASDDSSASATQLNPNLFTINDNYYNALLSSQANGPYIRHGVLLQYFTHNNLIANNVFCNTAYGAIDLHGEDEYANEIRNNVIKNISEQAMLQYGTNGGGAIELGNTGSTHDQSGPYNWIHNNRIFNSKYGVRIEYGTKKTLVEHNVILGCDDITEGTGILLGYTQGNVIRNNTILNNQGQDYSGIQLTKDKATRATRTGGPSYCRIYKNKISGNHNAVAINVQYEEQGNTIEENQTTANQVD